MNFRRARPGFSSFPKSQARLFERSEEPDPPLQDSPEVSRPFAWNKYRGGWTSSPKPAATPRTPPHTMPCYEMPEPYYLNKHGYNSYMFTTLKSVTKPLRLNLHDIGSFTLSHGKKLIVLVPENTPGERSDLETHAKGVCVISFHPGSAETHSYFRVNDLAFHRDVSNEVRLAFVKALEGWAHEIIWAEKYVYGSVWESRFRFDMVIHTPVTPDSPTAIPLAIPDYDLCNPDDAYSALFPGERVYVCSTHTAPQSPSREGPIYND